MLPVTASSQMVGTSGQARVGGIGRFGDQYHHGVVGGAMSRIPEHQVGWLEMDLSHKVGLNFFFEFSIKYSKLLPKHSEFNDILI